MKLMGIATLMISLTIPLSLMAKSKNSANVKIPDPVTIGGKVLSAGSYHVEWTASSGPVQVNFLKGKDVIATAHANVVNQKTVYPGAIETMKEPDKSSALEAIDLKNMSLHFKTNQSSNRPGISTSRS